MADDSDPDQAQCCVGLIWVQALAADNKSR